MRVTNLSLTNFRSYRRLELPLGDGLTVVVGDNAQGKSNLLEALYLLAIGKSYRASTERDLVSWEAAQVQGYAIAAATLAGEQGQTELRIGLDCMEGARAQKRVRINGIPKRASDLVGVMSAVLFSPEDIELVFGSPSVRRRYLDVLLAQVSRRYVQTLSPVPARAPTAQRLCCERCATGGRTSRNSPSGTTRSPPRGRS